MYNICTFLLLFKILTLLSFIFNYTTTMFSFLWSRHYFSLVQAVSCTNNAMIMFNDCLEVKLYVDSSNLRTIYAQNMKCFNSPFLFFILCKYKIRSREIWKEENNSRHYYSVLRKVQKWNRRGKRLDSRCLISGGDYYFTNARLKVQQGALNIAPSSAQYRNLEGPSTGEESWKKAYLSLFFFFSFLLDWTFTLRIDWCVDLDFLYTEKWKK